MSKDKSWPSKVAAKAKTKNPKDISLRDWFAGLALAGFAASRENSKWTADEIAYDAYVYADSMLEQRRS